MDRRGVRASWLLFDVREVQWAHKRHFPSWFPWLCPLWTGSYVAQTDLSLLCSWGTHWESRHLGIRGKAGRTEVQCPTLHGDSVRKKRKTNQWNVKFVMIQAFLAVLAHVSLCILAVALNWTHSMHIALHVQCISCGAVPCRAQIWDCCVLGTVFMLWSLIFKNATWVANLEIARVSKVF